MITRGMAQETVFEKQELPNNLNLHALTKHQLEQLAKRCGKVKKQKYPRAKNSAPLYGNLPRVLSQGQLRMFFDELYRFQNMDVYDDHCLMFFYGLRVGEVREVSVLTGQKLVRVVSDKCDRVEYLPLIEGTEILFERLRKRKRHSSGYIAKYFRETCDRLGDEFMYKYHENRRQFSTHCLRKTAGNMLRSMTGDPYKAAVFLRHNTRAVFGVTACYLHYSVDEMRIDLNKCFKELVEQMIL